MALPTFLGAFFYSFILICSFLLAQAPRKRPVPVEDAPIRAASGIPTGVDAGPPKKKKRVF